MTDVTDTTQLNTDADDQTTLIAVSAAVGAGLVVILAAGLAGLAGLAALTCYWLVKRKRHGLFTTVHDSHVATVCPSMVHFEYKNVSHSFIHVTCLLQALAVVVERN